MNEPTHKALNERMSNKLEDCFLYPNRFKNLADLHIHVVLEAHKSLKGKPNTVDREFA